MSDQIDDLVARLARLEDLEAIRHTWRDYCIRLDSADWIALGDVFTEDAILEMEGLAPLVEGLDGQYRGRHAIINDFYRRTGATNCAFGGTQFTDLYLAHLEADHIAKVELRRKGHPLYDRR